MSENNPVKVMTDSITSIPNLQEAFKQVMSDPVNFIIFIIIFSFLILNYIAKNTFLLTYWERREDKKQEKIDRYLSNNSDMDEMCAEIVREQRDAIIFKNATGIYAEKVFRCALIDLRKKMPYDVTWRMIRKSLSRFSLNDEKKIIVKPITKIETVAMYYNYIMGLLLLAIAVAVMYVSFYILTSNSILTFIDALTFIGIALLSSFLSVMVLSQNLPYIFAKRIYSELKNKPPQPDKC